MSTIRELVFGGLIFDRLVFDWLLNASVQIGLFAILAAALSPFIAKAKAKYQHCLYLAVFALCLAAPVFNTLWQPVRVWTHSSSRYRGRNTLTITSGSGTGTRRRTSRAFRSF